MAKCSFCGKTIKEGSGIMYVKKNGNILHFCSSKCFKNYLKLGRKPAKHKWTAKHREIKVKKSSKKTNRRVAERPKRKIRRSRR